MAEYDVLVIGSGFGGSVASLRLAEKGYKVCVLEAGRRFSDKDFPKTSWRLRRFLFLPRLGLTGIQRIHVLPDVLVLAGAGVGGGVGAGVGGGVGGGAGEQRTTLQQSVKLPTASGVA